MWFGTKTNSHRNLPSVACSWKAQTKALKASCRKSSCTKRGGRGLVRETVSEHVYRPPHPGREPIFRLRENGFAPRTMTTTTQIARLCSKRYFLDAQKDADCNSQRVADDGTGFRGVLHKSKQLDVDDCVGRKVCQKRRIDNNDGQNHNNLRKSSLKSPGLRVTTGMPTDQ